MVLVHPRNDDVPHAASAWTARFGSPSATQPPFTQGQPKIMASTRWREQLACLTRNLSAYSITPGLLAAAWVAICGQNCEASRLALEGRIPRESTAVPCVCPSYHFRMPCLVRPSCQEGMVLSRAPFMFLP